MSIAPTCQIRTLCQTTWQIECQNIRQIKCHRECQTWEGGDESQPPNKCSGGVFSLRFMLCVLHLRAVHHRDHFFAAGRFTAATNPVVAAWRIILEILHGESSKPCCCKVVGDSFIRPMHSKRMKDQTTQPRVYPGDLAVQQAFAKTFYNTTIECLRYVFPQRCRDITPEWWRYLRYI